MNSSPSLKLNHQLLLLLPESSDTSTNIAMDNSETCSQSAPTLTLDSTLDGQSLKDLKFPQLELNFTILPTCHSPLFKEESMFQFHHTLLKLLMEFTSKLLTFKSQLTSLLDKTLFATQVFSTSNRPQTPPRFARAIAHLHFDRVGSVLAWLDPLRLSRRESPGH